MKGYKNWYYAPLAEQSAWVATWFMKCMYDHPFIVSIDKLWETVRCTRQACTREAFRRGAKIAKEAHASRKL